MKRILIVESPAKVKTISKFLGKSFKVLSTVGHIMDLPEKELGVSINDTVKIKYVILKGKDKTINELKKEAVTADEIYLAPDPDREGEIIAWHVEQEMLPLIKPKAKIYRITFNEITKQAIEQAVSEPRDVDLNKVAAQQARRILDRLVGYEVSPILWRKVSKGLSAGRVQSVTLKLVVEREEQIKSFVPEEYWTIEGTFSSEHGTIIAELSQIKTKKAEIKNEQEATKIVDGLKKESYAIKSIKDSKRSRNPLPPFMTSTLQQSSYNQLGFSVQKTMEIAQKLYEGIPLDDQSGPTALITYMRTDSLRISDVAIKQTREHILNKYGKDYLPPKGHTYTKGKAQDAHEAIRPIDVNLTPDKVKRYLTSEASALYELIWKRFVASQMKPAIFAQRQVTITGGIYTFKVTGSTLLFDGFLKVYQEKQESMEDGEDKKVVLPAKIAENDALDLKTIKPKQHFTQPPPRFNEASLVKELEKDGVGRPSTYATILKTIQARAYTELDPKKRFVPTELGILVTKMLNQNLPHIMDIGFTATMEEKLDEIAQGSLDRDKLIKTFYENFEQELEIFREEKSAKRMVEETELQCPQCKGGKVLIRFGKAGHFASCNQYPECSFTSNFERATDGSIKLIESETKMLEEQCPQCKSGLKQTVGRYGPFIACTGYPNCKYTRAISAGFSCPECKDNDVVVKSYKKTKFLSCSNYPKCKFTAPENIEKTPCKACKWPFLVSKIGQDKKMVLTCHNKSCKSNR